MRTALGMLAATVAAGLAGCGAGPGSSCTYSYHAQVSPATATADSTAKAPGNQQKFSAGIATTETGSGCVIPYEPVSYATWTNPDTVHISISSAADETNGLATCLGPTTGPVVLTASFGTGASALSVTAQLTCQ